MAETTLPPDGPGNLVLARCCRAARLFWVAAAVALAVAPKAARAAEMIRITLNGHLLAAVGIRDFLTPAECLKARDAVVEQAQIIVCTDDPNGVRRLARPPRRGGVPADLYLVHLVMGEIGSRRVASFQSASDCLRAADQLERSLLGKSHAEGGGDPVVCAMVSYPLADRCHQGDKECIRLRWLATTPADRERVENLCVWDPRVNSATTPPTLFDREYWKAWRLFSDAQRDAMEKACDTLRNMGLPAAGALP